MVIGTGIVMAACLVGMLLMARQTSTPAAPDGAGHSTGGKAVNPPLPDSVNGRAIEVSEFGTGTKTVPVIGGIHGDEPDSVVLTRALARYLRTLPTARFTRRVVVMPAVNPDGLDAHRRRNAHQVDLNRNFPTLDFGIGQRVGRYYGGSVASSEPETRAMLQVAVQYHPVLIISIHAPLGCINYDGPAETIARQMAHLDRFPVMPCLPNPTPGSLGTYFGKERGIPVITLELVPGQRQWVRHGPAILTAIWGETSMGND